LTCLQGDLALAGPPGYLPGVGPTPLRFGAGSVDLAALRAGWPPLLMHTPAPKEPVVATNTVPDTALTPLVPPGPVTPPPSAMPVENPYANGVIPPPEGGWWHTYFQGTNGPAGGLTLPVSFVPPQPTPPRNSRATFEIVP
jgi:hypothetical protein